MGQERSREGSIHILLHGLVCLVGSRNCAWLRRFDLSVAPRFPWFGIELGRTNLEGGGLPFSSFRSARRVHNSTKAAFPEAPYNAGRQFLRSYLNLSIFFMSLPIHHEVQAPVRIRPVCEWFAHNLVLSPRRG